MRTWTYLKAKCERSQLSLLKPQTEKRNCPLAKLKQKGVRICLGTDGPASNNALDIFREMYLASLLSTSIKREVPS